MNTAEGLVGSRMAIDPTRPTGDLALLKMHRKMRAYVRCLSASESASERVVPEF